MDRQVKDYARFNSSSNSSMSEVFEPISSSSNAKQRTALVEWLNGILPNHSLPINASDEELRAFLIDGSVLCQILNKLKPGSVPECDDSVRSSQSRAENVQRFLSAMDEMGLPGFHLEDLEKGSMKIVLDCLITLQTQFMLNNGKYNGADESSRSKMLGDRLGSVGSTPKDETFRVISSPPFGENRHSKSLYGLRSPRMADLPAARISEMMKSNSLDNAPTQSLLSVINGILDESVDMKNGEIPHRVACLLRKVIQEIERRICTQAEHLRTQNNLFKAREEKYQSRIRVLEALSSGTSEETQIVMTQLQQIKSDKNKIEEKKKVEDHDTTKLMKEKDDLKREISNLKQELERVKRLSEQESSKVEAIKGKDEVIQEIANLKQELERVRRSTEQESSKVEAIKGKDEVIQEIGNLRQELKDKDELIKEIADLKIELEIARRSITETELSAKMNAAKDKDEANQVIANLRQELKEKDVLKQEIAILKKELDLARSSKQEISTMKAVKESNEVNQEIEGLRKEKDKLNQEIASLRQEVKEKDNLNQEIASLRQDVKEKEKLNQEIAYLRQQLELAKSSCEQESVKAVGAQQELENRLKEATRLQTESRNRVKELEALSESKSKWWNDKQKMYLIYTEFQLGALRELRFASQSIQQEVSRTQTGYSEEFSNLGSRIKILGDAAKNYYPLLAENRKMHNELQELKGNIRVYCRVRPFLPGQKGKQSIIEYIGENGELVVANPSKQGKEGRRSFSFDKVYGPTATQAEVYRDTQPLIQSVLDGYNVCIFAYGQTGSGKTYTMTGPDGATEEDWGVNYRALNDLFRISQTREGIYKYDVSVQMVEVYNEQVRDLLSNDGQKKLGIMSATQSNGLAVPDACIQAVNTTDDVMKLMNIGLNNRAKGSTAMNERSSRSHSILSIHTRGQDIKTGSSLRGSLHLVDLAGSERVDRSEVTGDRLKEAQHINKSLSALGDVIFALAQKAAHVPYRNSKLTQVLQSSLGGRAKTLMFVQLNPDATSFGETTSTLKFAERVSGVELGAAKSSKDGRDVRELMEQVACLKDTIAKKDEEIEALQMSKDPKSGATAEKRSTSSLRTEPEGSAETIHIPDDERLANNIDKPKSTPRVPRAPVKPVRESANRLTGLRKPPSGTNPSIQSTRKWQ